jgi:hypothetical protein
MTCHPPIEARKKMAYQLSSRLPGDTPGKIMDGDIETMTELIHRRKRAPRRRGLILSVFVVDGQSIRRGPVGGNDLPGWPPLYPT